MSQRRVTGETPLVGVLEPVPALESTVVITRPRQDLV